MTDKKRRYLIINGIGLLITAVLVGWMFLFMLVGEIVLFPLIPATGIEIPGEGRAWNMAHLEGITNGLLLLALAALTPLLHLSARQNTWLFWSSIVTTWGFTLPAWANALAGTRSLAFGGGPFGPSLANDIIYSLGWPPVVAVHIMLALMLIGAWRGIKKTL